MLQFIVNFLLVGAIIAAWFLYFYYGLGPTQQPPTPDTREPVFDLSNDDERDTWAAEPELEERF